MNNMDAIEVLQTTKKSYRVTFDDMQYNMDRLKRNLGDELHSKCSTIYADLNNMVNESIDMAIAALDPLVSVEERLPEKAGRYLTISDVPYSDAEQKYQFEECLWYDADDTEEWYNCAMDAVESRPPYKYEVTHWMPIPQLPEGDKQ